jgi:hypothetical protein
METKKQFIEFLNKNQTPNFAWFETYARENIKGNFLPNNLRMFLQVSDMPLLISNLCDKYNLCLLYDKNGILIKVID